MANNRITFDTVRLMGLSLPGVEAGATYGLPSLKVHGKMFACLAGHSSAEPNTLAARLDKDRRDEPAKSWAQVTLQTS